jgi:hypothetical protein
MKGWLLELAAEYERWTQAQDRDDNPMQLIKDMGVATGNARNENDHQR